jgi:ELWxxDGT repeat protein
MKKFIQHTIFILAIAASCALPPAANAQALFKDLHPGTVSSNPKDFITINGTMYFITVSSSPYIHRLWKSDGTAAGTEIVKDSIIISNTNGIMTLLNVNGTLFYTLAKNGSATSATKTELWKSDGTTANTVLIDSLTHSVGGGSGGAPLNWTVVGSKLFFNMGNGSTGRELWVSDGTKAGTTMVTDLYTGNSMGVMDHPMAAFNGKVYFRGCTALGNIELFASDGTAGGTVLVKEINPSSTGSKSSDPGNWIVYKNELYFSATDGTNAGIWKTDGTNTTLVVVGAFGNPRLFKNTIYYQNYINLWKTDGTAGGTTQVADSCNVIVGSNNDYLIGSYLKSLPTPPYFTTLYTKTDGVTSTRVPYMMGAAASFQVVNNKMYMSSLDSGSSSSISLYESDGTDAGTAKVFTANYMGVPYAFGNAVFFSNHAAATGYELWTYKPAGGSNGIKAIQTSKPGANIYPNPSKGVFNFHTSDSYTELHIFNLLGELVYTEKIDAPTKEIILSDKPKGVYFYKLTGGNTGGVSGKIVLE